MELFLKGNRVQNPRNQATEMKTSHKENKIHGICNAGGSADSGKSSVWAEVRLEETEAFRSRNALRIGTAPWLPPLHHSGNLGLVLEYWSRGMKYWRYSQQRHLQIVFVWTHSESKFAHVPKAPKIIWNLKFV